MRQESKSGREDVGNPNKTYELFVKERREILRRREQAKRTRGQGVQLEEVLFDWVDHHRSHWMHDKKD